MNARTRLATSGHTIKSLSEAARLPYGLCRRWISEGIAHTTKGNKENLTAFAKVLGCPVADLWSDWMQSRHYEEMLTELRHALRQCQMHGGTLFTKSKSIEFQIRDFIKEVEVEINHREYGSGLSSQTLDDYFRSRPSQ